MDISKNLNKYSGKLYKKIFFSMLPASIIHGWILCAGVIIDSIFTSKFVGSDGMAVIGFFNPIQVILWFIINIIVNGSNVLIGNSIGKGKSNKANSVFSFTTISFGFISLVLIFIIKLAINFYAKCTDIPQEAVNLFKSYVYGTLIGLPALMISGYFSSLLAYDNKHTETASKTAIIFTLSDIVLDYVFVKIFNWRMFGLAFATSLSNYISVFYMLSRYLRNKSVLKFNFKGMSFKFLKTILSVGIPAASIEIYIFIRVFAWNKLLMNYGGIVAVSAYAITCSVENILSSVSNGISNSALSVGSVIAGEQDFEFLKSFSKVVHKFGFLIMLFCSSIIFIFSDFFASVFSGKNQDTLLIASVAIKCLSISFLFSVIFNSSMRFYQAEKYNSLVAVYYFFSNLIFSVCPALLLTKHFGINGIWMSLILKDFLSLLMIYVYSCFKNKKLFLSPIDLITNGKKFDIAPENKLCISVYSIEEIINVSIKIEEFCTSHNFDKKKSMYSAMAIEEMAGNIVQHGFLKDNKPHSIDICVIVENENLIIKIKDDCIPFDPKTKYNLIYHNEDPTKNVGIKMIYKLCKNVQYQELFGLNVLTINV